MSDVNCNQLTIEFNTAEKPGSTRTKKHSLAYLLHDLRDVLVNEGIT